MLEKTRKIPHLRFYCLIVVLIALIFARYSFGIDVPRLIISGVIICIAVFGNRSEVIAASLCCIPLHEAVDFYVTIVFCTALLVVKSFPRLKISYPIFLGIIMICWEIIHCLFTDFGIMELVAPLIPIIFVVASLSVDLSDIEYPFVVRSIAIMTAAMCAATLLNSIVRAGFNFSSAIADLQRLGVLEEGETAIGGRINPNALGVIVVLMMTGILQLRSLGKAKIIDYVFAVFLLTFGVLTSSRTFLVCLLLALLLLIMGQQGSFFKKIKLLAVILLFAVVTLFILTRLFPSVLEYYIGRFDSDDITTGRDKLMIIFHQFIISNSKVLLFGIGVTDFGDKVTNVYDVANNVPHNSIQEIIIAWGIPGLIMFGCLIWLIIVNARRKNKQFTILNFIPLIIILVKSMAGQLLTSGYSMLALIFSYLSMCQNFKIDRNDASFLIDDVNLSPDVATQTSDEGELREVSSLKP